MPTGRFAPSPTAPLHLGNLRTAMLSWLFARSSRSPFVLRIEDLDGAASRAEHEASHLQDLQAVGLDWDGSIDHQSAHFDRYREVIDALTASGRTYPCYCTRREVLEASAAPHDHLPEGAYPGTCRELTRAEHAARAREGRPPALRLRADGAVEVFDDALHGPQEGSVDDFVIRRNDGNPAYNLAVVVDDADAGVGEVVRGDDLLSSTPRQILLAGLLDLPVPRYAHVPLVLGPDGERLAKRHGAVSLADCVASGATVAEVRTLLAASLGLVASGEPVDMSSLVDRFDIGTLPREPWVLPMEGEALHKP